MTPSRELAVLAAEAKQAQQVVDQLRDRLDAVSDPYFMFKSLVVHMTTAVHLIDEARRLIESEARCHAGIEAQRKALRTVTP